MFKLIFLYKSKSSLKVLIYFLLSKIKNLFFKREIIKHKRKHQSLISKKKITNDYFSSHAFNFFYYLKSFEESFDYLEIGSYEGNSAIFVASNFKNANIFCIDSWNKTEEYIDHIDFSDIEKNFDENTKSFDNIQKIKKNSDDFFLNNHKKFDVIYIDGYHHGSQVFKDCVNSWKFLKNEGYLICDDYIWNFYKNINDNPCYAINKFLREIKGYFKIEKISNSQIFLKKIN